jgi:hypothetical protein
MGNRRSDSRDRSDGSTPVAVALEESNEANRKLKWVIIRFAVVLILAIGISVFIVVREAGQARELKEALIQSCETSPVRETLTEILTEEIKESHGPLLGKAAEAFHLTLEEIEQITDKSNAKKEQRIGQIEPSDCEAQYTK